MKLLASAIMAGMLCVAPVLAAAESTDFSGFELFAGIRIDGATIGATFSGWTDDSTQWVPFRQSTGGFVSGSINYIGRPGFGKTVTIVGGKWTWLEADDHTTHSGPVLSGTVQWPANAASSLSANCGPGVVFPPKIWGLLDLPGAP